MNIALLHYSVPPVVGGVESVIAHHARLMSADGHSVRLIAARGESLGEQIPLTLLPQVGSRHAVVTKVKEQLDRGEVTADFESLRGELAGQLQGALSGVDILIAHNVCSLHKNLALTAAIHRLHISKKLPPLILWHHDLAWTTPRYRAELHEGYPWGLLREAWGGVKQVTVSEMRRQELAKLFQVSRDEIAVVPNGVDIGKFHKLEEQTHVYVRQLKLLDASPLLLLPVRITPRKNVELALQVLANLKQYFPDAKLVVTGPLGPHNPANAEYFKKLTALRQALGLFHSAYFLAELADGYIPDEVIADFYQLADALFLPSREEGFGIPILEAGLAGLPIFCSDIPPLRSLGGIYATYFSPDADSRELAKLIADQLSSNPVFRLRADLRRQYTWERIYTEKIAPLLATMSIRRGP